MTCNHCQRLLSPYLDDELSSKERDEVLAHLAQCAPCSTYLRQLEASRRQLHALPDPQVSSAMQAQLWSRLQDQRLTAAAHRTRAKMPWWRSWTHRERWTTTSRTAKWTGWSLGTLATATASLFFYFTTLQSPPEVSAEEVVLSMDELLDSLDPQDGVRLLSEEAPEEQLPDWLVDDAWLLEEGDSQTGIEDLWR